jgi:hypothetical protein
MNHATIGVTTAEPEPADQREAHSGDQVAGVPEGDEEVPADERHAGHRQTVRVVPVIEVVNVQVTGLRRWSEQAPAAEAAIAMAVRVRATTFIAGSAAHS